MEHELRLQRLALTGALGRGDAAGAAALYAGDGRLLTPRAALIEGRGQIEAFWRAGIQLGLTRVELDVTELRRFGGTALEIGRYNLAFDGGAESTADSGKYFVLHRRSGGEWVRAVDVFNPDGLGRGRLDRKEEG